MSHHQEIKVITIIDHLMGWPGALPFPSKKADTIVHVFIKQLSA